jgi:hypothetical protein
MTIISGSYQLGPEATERLRSFVADKGLDYSDLTDMDKREFICALLPPPKPIGRLRRFFLRLDYAWSEFKTAWRDY